VMWCDVLMVQRDRMRMRIAPVPAPCALTVEYFLGPE
jgi:hypothetical protein